MPLESYILLFPIAFMLHELEEIALLPDWFNNKIVNNEKVPSFIRKQNMTNRKFTLIVLEQFILLSFFVVFCSIFKYYNLFLGLVIAYVIHVVVHILQMLMIKMYVPGVFFGIISTFICVFILIKFIPLLDVSKVLFSTFSLLVIIVANLLLCHKLVR